MGAGLELGSRARQCSALRTGAARVRRGFTLIELLLILAILGVLAGLVLPAYSQYVDRTKVGIAIGDIGEISRRIKSFQQEVGGLPSSLSQVDAHDRRDPWGRPYVYVNLQSLGVSAARKNKNLVPINSDYDLYSIGKDGDSRKPLTAQVSRDDVLRASDGKFIGLASNFEP